MKEFNFCKWKQIEFSTKKKQIPVYNSKLNFKYTPGFVLDAQNRSIEVT